MGYGHAVCCYDDAVAIEVQENDSLGLTEAAWLLQQFANESTCRVQKREPAERRAAHGARDNRSA